MKLSIFLLLPVIALAQLERPSLGYTVDNHSTLRPVYGIAASSTLGEPVANSVQSFACADSLCVLQSENAVTVYGPYGQQAIADWSGQAIRVATTQGRALVFFPESKQVGRWSPESGLTLSGFDPSGELLSMQLSGDGFDIAVRRADVVWIEHISADGGVATLGSIVENDADHPVVGVHLLREAYLVSTSEDVKLVRTGGTTITFPVSRVRAFFQMSTDYIEAITEHGNWVICVAAGSESANLLPGTTEAME